jgi:hypothetical protein
MGTQADTKVLPLRVLREQVGMKPKTVVEKGTAISDHFPKTTDHLYVIELRGTTNYHLITAFASIYDKKADEIARIADYKNI